MGLYKLCPCSQNQHADETASGNDFLEVWEFPNQISMKLASEAFQIYQKKKRAKGAAKASCGETVVQKGVFGESVSSLPPLRFALKTHKNLKGQRGNGPSKNTLLDDRFSARRFRRSFGAPPKKIIFHAKATEKKSSPPSGTSGSSLQTRPPPLNFREIPPGAFPRGRKKTNKHKHFRRDGLRDKQEPSLGQMGPLPGTKVLNGTRPWDKPAFLCLIPQ